MVVILGRINIGPELDHAVFRVDCDDLFLDVPILRIRSR